MSATSVSTRPAGPSTPPALPARPAALRLYALEFRSEIVKLLRMPSHTIPGLLFPAMFYMFFGVMFGKSAPQGGIMLSRYLIATYGAFGVIGASLWGLGAGVAIERGQGWLTVKRATPMPLSAYFAAKLATSMVFALTVVLILVVLGATLGGVTLTAGMWLGLIVVLWLGALPFCALGLAIGYLAGPNSAPAVINVIYLPLSFVSGLWIPVEGLPPVIRSIAVFLPPYHLGQLALGVIGYGQGSALEHLGALAAATLVFVLLAAWAYRRDEGKTYG